MRHSPLSVVSKAFAFSSVYAKGTILSAQFAAISELLYFFKKTYPENIIIKPLG